MPKLDNRRGSLVRKILAAEGVDDEEAFLHEIVFDSVCPNICTTCHGVADGEPDADRNWCEVCGTNTCVSYLVLRGMI